MAQIDVILVCGRTIEQGTSLEIGKGSEEYFRSVAAVEMSPSDLESLKITEGDNVEVSTSFGSVVVRSRKSDGLEPCMAFMPYGPWANRVFSAYTGGTGMPHIKNISATNKSAKDQPIPSLEKLVELLRSGR